LAVILGIIVGLLMGRFREVEHFLDLYINASMSAPMTAFVPVLILWFALGVESRIAVVFLFAVFVIVINTMTGVKQVDRTFLEMARSFGAKETEVFYKIILPAAMPAIMAGVRLGLGRAGQGMVAEEMVPLCGGCAVCCHSDASYRRHDYDEIGSITGPATDRLESGDRYRVKFFRNHNLAQRRKTCVEQSRKECQEIENK